MTENCLDIGTIQAFLDGELASERLEAVSRHIALCDDCAILLTEAEEESAIAFTALEQEFNGFVPTSRLWTKINDSIEREKKPFWKTIRAYFSMPTVAGFASLIFVVGLFAALISLKTNDGETSVVAKLPVDNVVNSPVMKKNSPSSVVEPESKSASSARVAASDGAEVNNFKAVKANFSPREVINRQPLKIQKASVEMISKNPNPLVVSESRSANPNVLGEESYIKTIATLEKTVDGRKDEVLKPAARFAFERDLAVTDDAIIKMRAEVKKNPKNEAAKDVLRASYQNKIDLLNSIAEKTELMASLK